jgi:hypothetical protein
LSAFPQGNDRKPGYHSFWKHYRCIFGQEQPHAAASIRLYPRRTHDRRRDHRHSRRNRHAVLYQLENADVSGYLLTATGRAAAASFVYTLDQSGKRATTGVPAGWTKKDNCWVDRKDGSCTQ